LLRRTGALSAAASLRSPTGLGRGRAEKLLTGALELFSGVWTLRGTPSLPSVAAAAFMLGWGGLSVHFQTLSVLSESGLRPGLYLLGKALHGLLSAALAAAAFPALSAPLSAPSVLLLLPALISGALLFIKSTGKRSRKRI
ncbi:MAG: hypothetical protein IK136_06085, partial [Oscillospiraceae bacterium]|nr:hypothetical protein [Oscillospiraceae bacterium]